MVKIAVLCKDNRDAGHGFCELLNWLRGNNARINRLIFHQWTIGTKKCRVRFYSCSENDSWIGTKVDVALGFPVKTQREILKEGVKPTRKFAEIREDYNDILMKYF